MEKEEAQEILNQALPALLFAREALSNLNKNDITEIRSFATPPEPVQVVSECVAILLGYKEVNWKVAKQMMSDPRFLTTLKTLNCDVITAKQQSQTRAKLKARIVQLNRVSANRLRILREAGDRKSAHYNLLMRKTVRAPDVVGNRINDEAVETICLA